MGEINNEYKHFDTLLDGVLVLNKDGEVEYCNNTLSALINLPIRRIKSHTPFDEYITFEPSVFNKLEDINEAMPYKEVTFTSKTGKTGKVQVTVQKWTDQKSKISSDQWLLYVRDVTLEATLHSKYHGELNQKEEVIVKLKAAQDTLQEYSKGLESKVKERTADLASTNRTLSAMLDSLGQGFILVAGQDQKCSRTYSRISVMLFEADPTEKELSALLKIPQNQKENFSSWFKMLFDEPLPFSELIKLAPKTFPHSQGLYVALEFHPVRDEEDKVKSIVIVATDKTKEMAALKEAEKEQARAKCVVKLAKDKNLFWRFIERVESTLHYLSEAIPHFEEDLKVREQTLNLAHTLKGEANVFWMLPLVGFMHELEDYVKTLSKEPASKTAPSRKVVANLVSQSKTYLEAFLKEYEPIIGKHRAQSERTIEIPRSSLMEFYKKLSDKPTLASAFEEELLNEAVGTYFKQYDDLAETLAKRFGKQINPIQLTGANFKVNVEKFSNLFENFVHIFTNSVIHGIETPDVRTRLNKPVNGTISIDFKLTATKLDIVAQDDGKGVDPQQVRQKLSELFGNKYTKENDNQIIQHILDSQFSTAEEITELAGRGIGLGALKKAVSDLGGTILVKSKLGEGIRFEISVPLLEQKKAA